jgi:nicotinamidase/pyrazinamidase
VIKHPKRALVLVDLQYDFLPGGALAVPDGDAVVPVAVKLLDAFDVVVATQDFHPPGHGSFAGSRGAAPFTLGELGGLPQVFWPDHCVQGTRGAALVSELPPDRIAKVFPKGTNPGVDSYSGFFDNDGEGDTGLAAWLEDRAITELWILGLATDYCVKATAMDAVELGFEVKLVLEGCRAVEMTPGAGEAAVREMTEAGIEVVEAASAHAAG